MDSPLLSETPIEVRPARTADELNRQSRVRISTAAVRIHGRSDSCALANLSHVLG